jgi:hypothetical protein
VGAGVTEVVEAADMAADEYVVFGALASPSISKKASAGTLAGSAAVAGTTLTLGAAAAAAVVLAARGAVAVVAPVAGAACCKNESTCVVQ